MLTGEPEPQSKEQNAQFAAKRRLALASRVQESQQALKQEPQEQEVQCNDSGLSEDDVALAIAAQHEALASDIRAIRQKYPDETAKNVSDLGMEYVGLCACGMPAIIAYESVRAKQKSVPFIGDVKGEYAAEKDYFTKAEVDGMAKQDIKKNYTKIRNSMEKW